jgi:hypothetical protein
MLVDYLACYENYLKKHSSGATAVNQ